MLHDVCLYENVVIEYLIAFTAFLVSICNGKIPGSGVGVQFYYLWHSTRFN